MAVQQSTKLEFHHLDPRWERAVAELNERLESVPPDVPHYFPTRPSPKWSREAGAASGVYQDYLVAAHDDVVRGGYVLKWQQFDVGSIRETIGNLQLPLSEGLVDRRFALVGIEILRDAAQRAEKLYALGMGGLDRSLPRLLKSLGWQLIPVPMRVRVVRPARVLRTARYLRKTLRRRLACDLLASSGVGWLAAHAYQLWRTKGGRPRASASEVGEFGAWADAIWEAGAAQRVFGAVRGASALNHLYPSCEDRFTRLRVDIGGKAAGWALLTNRAQTQHRLFGSLKLGAIVDCAARPGAERAVIQEATAWLARNGADLIVTNQAHAAWLQALDDSGYLAVPTNFIFAASPRLVESISACPDWTNQLHINRGDGDGPINL